MVNYITEETLSLRLDCPVSEPLGLLGIRKERKTNYAVCVDDHPFTAHRAAIFNKDQLDPSYFFFELISVSLDEKTH